MKKENGVNKIGYKAINFLRVVYQTAKSLKRKNHSFDDKKKIERLEFAILRSIDNIRRAIMDDEVMR